MTDSSYQVPTSAKCATYVKVINFITGVLLILFGSLGIFTTLSVITKGQFFQILSPVFIIAFGLMIFAAELKIKFIIKYFQFLKTLLGRGIFNIFLSSVLYYFFEGYSNYGEIISWIACSIIFVIGLLYIIIHFAGSNQYSNDLRAKLGTDEDN